MGKVRRYLSKTQKDSRFRGNDGMVIGNQSGAAHEKVVTPKSCGAAPLMFFRPTPSFPRKRESASISIELSLFKPYLQVKEDKIEYKNREDIKNENGNKSGPID
jgi:hypothetical protein